MRILRGAALKYKQLKAVQMQRNSESISTGAKRIDKACDHVNDFWFPVNSELLAKIKLGVKGGVYDLDCETLVSSITGDFSLFMYCLRELIRMLNQEGVQTPPLVNPVDVLRHAGIERLKKILDVDEYKISKHSFSSIGDPQVDCFGEALISASSAQVLAPAFNINPETGYTAALIRQLGRTLIAWNYPTVYSDALTKVTPERSIDQVIAEKMGFSPTLLAVRMLVGWGIPVQMCEMMFLFDEEEQDDYDEEECLNGILGGAIGKLCLIGEALARANNPRAYPNARKEWEYAKEQISLRIGDKGLQMIQEAFTENLEDYLTYMPEIFTPALILEPELHLAAHERDKLTIRNPYIPVCDARVKTALTSLYAGLGESEISEKSISLLVKDIIPASGFLGGYIYTIDPGISMLVSQTRIGTPKIKEFKSIDYSLITSDADSVAIAFRSSEPVIEFLMSTDKELITGVSGIIGLSNRVGVLYLEMAHGTYSENEKQVIVHFKAFCRAITDCLNLK